MKYSKPSLSYEEQADLLIGRGLQADRTQLVNTLKSVNYYRLSGYLYPFRKPDDSFRSGTTFEKVWRRYRFDRQLRLHVLDAIERVEISVKTSIAYCMAHKYGPFSYCSQEYLPGLEPEEFQMLHNRIEKERARSREVFVAHFRDKYGDVHSDLPVWMVIEIMDFGGMLTFFRGIETGLKKDIAKRYAVPDIVLFSWLRAVNGVRNICAHHGRLWNRVFGNRPMIPRKNKHPDWHIPVEVRNDRIFGILTVLRYMLKYDAPQSGWADRIRDLLSKFSDVPLRSMGFPDNWERCPIWIGSADDRINPMR